MNYIVEFVRSQASDYLFGCYSEINEWKHSGTITNGYLLDLQSRFNLNSNQLLGVGALLHDQLIQKTAILFNICIQWLINGRLKCTLNKKDESAFYYPDNITFAFYLNREEHLQRNFICSASRNKFS
uniref:Uncharacterized protein n=1 Tax=Lysinibacillus sphaericus TaxID=1421 RepID=A0A6H0A0S7_LYSSH|nr:hypothetical protein [Lysinibacillus sphaericus]